jgi:hypothetical protein
MDKEVAIHRLALDESPTVFKPRDHAGVPVAAVGIKRLLFSVAGPAGCLNAEMGTQRPQH